MSQDHLDELITRLNDGDVDAAERAFLAYEPYLRMAVRRQLTGPLRAKLDSMDIVQSVWADVLSRFRESGWRFADRAHLRAFLLRVTHNRLIDRRRQHHQAIARERPLEEPGLEGFLGSTDPRPSEVVQGQELWEQMLAYCPASHRDLLRMRRQGLPLAEIAARSGLHEGSVRRIFYDLARRLAEAQAEDASSSVGAAR
jgi:RNA polymerase sigma-70 factor (ECF subfamily)